MNILKNKLIWIIIVLLVMALVGRAWQGERERRHGDPISSLTIDTPTHDFIIVQLDGAVAKPGVYQITADAHVIDLIFLAGGLLPEARLDKINLAKILQNGDRIHVLGALKPRTKSTKKRKSPHHG